ncbi:MAG: MBL fold metallo-hydrolase [Planctomycetota bacterium]
MSDQRLQIYVTNDPIYAENGYTLYLRTDGPCWIIDPGLPRQAEQIIEHIQEKALQPQAIVLTHAHADHIAGIDELRDTFADLPVLLAREEWAALTDPMENLSGMVGLGFATEVTDPRDLPVGETLELDGTRWQVLETSGHSPGGRTFYCAELKTAIVGDALFAGGVGRVDFHHSNGDRLLRNIRNNLMTLPGEVRVLSGHGPATTIERERSTNPYILHGF